MVPEAPSDRRTRAERDAARQRRAARSASAGSALRPAGDRERPQAPWGSFPLSELIVLAALVLGVAGLVVWGERGRMLLLAAMALGSLAGVELSLREHLAGYRSHSMLLAAACTFAVVSGFLLATGPTRVWAVLVLGALVFAAAFWGFRELFKSRSGGLGFR